MFILSTFLFISSISSVIRRDISIYISRASVILLVCCVSLAYYTTNLTIMGKSLGLFGDLFYISPLTQTFKISIFLLSTIILLIASFYPRKHENLGKYLSLNRKKGVKSGSIYIYPIKNYEKSDLCKPNTFEEHYKVIICKTFFLLILSYVVYLSYKNGLAFYMQFVLFQALSIIGMYKPYIIRWNIELLFLFIIINILIIMFYMLDILYIDTLINHMDIGKLLNPEPNPEPRESLPIPENNVSQDKPKTVVNLHSTDITLNNGLRYRMIYDKNQLDGSNLIKVTGASNELGSKLQIITFRVMGSETTGTFEMTTPHPTWDRHNHEMVCVNNKWGFWSDAAAQTTLEQNNIEVKHDSANILQQVINNKPKWFIPSSQTKR